MAQSSNDLEVWRDPPVYRLLSGAILLDGNHVNKVWSGLGHRAGSTEPGVPMIIKWMPSQIPLITELACSIAAQALKLPVPSGGLILCEPDQLPTLPIGAGLTTQVCFGSHLRDKQAVYLAPTDEAVADFVWRKLIESGVAAPGAAWDELVANGDRHHENVLYDGVKWWLFDHERALEPLANVMKRFAQQVVQQQMLEHKAARNQLAGELLKRLPVQHGLEVQPNALLLRKQRLAWVANAVSKWNTGDTALDEMFRICEVVLHSIGLRLPVLASHLQVRLSRPDPESLWNTSSNQPKSPD